MIGSNGEGYKTVYKSIGQFPIKTIQWDYNQSQWTINGQVGDTNIIRFTNNESGSCPPSDGWSYLYDSGSSEPSDIAIDIIMPEFPGPCKNSKVDEECDSLFDGWKWLDICDTLVEKDARSVLIAACKVDYCLVNTPETLRAIMEQFVIQCKSKSPNQILCNWENRFTGTQQVCGENEKYNGCADSCDFTTCNDLLSNNEYHHHRARCSLGQETFPSCVCKPNFYLQNGNCVSKETCRKEGWTEWSTWSTCPKPCVINSSGTFSRNVRQRRVRSCNGSSCQALMLLSTDVDVKLCTKTCPTVPNEFTECRAYSDSHVITFDGANNDLYGKGTFVLAQSASAANSTGHFRVRVVTESFAISTVYFDFVDSTDSVIATIETNRYGNSNFIDRTKKAISVPLIGSRSGNGFNFTFTKSGTRMVITTSFGVELIHNRLHVRLRVHQGYTVPMKGICGNNDGDKENDYQNADGAVLPYEQSDSSVETVKSWMIDGEVPESAGVSGLCQDSAVEAKCNSLFDASWLVVCHNFVSIETRSRLISTCKLDYCMRKTPETIHAIIEQFVIQCKLESPRQLLCNWELELNESQPVCGDNAEYVGCASNWDLASCDDVRSNESFIITNEKGELDQESFASCVCKPNFYRQNGRCVTVEVCLEEGWSEWSGWSMCPDPCSIVNGKQRKVRECQGPSCSSLIESSEQDCGTTCGTFF